ncbi:hypothetical protein C8C85_1024 [Flavobacterium sp. 103]|uniref:hypothetical protein n=1 Tax=Flavobacterium sp. 103 TaxID=2135624 RepID=UPI000D5F2332|nr:hypothetical protein [Flavobacterium sp. 103]PVX45241.1 hypothetical protein C8C85_1024 [Flavobacterium sp. 103]
MKKSVTENQFKEKINAREITPSKASWDRLDAMLTVAEKPKRSFKWMYIAASILGFLLIGTLYFNQNKNVINKDKIVVNESKVIPEIKTVPEKINLLKRVEATKNIEKQLASTGTKSEVGSDSVLSNSGIQVAEKEIVQEQQIVIINQEAEQKVVPTKPKYVNADELLASVDNASPRKSSAVAKSNVKVNSNELLTQVDGELDLTFREKAIKTVNQNFKAVKLALSNRNSE